ncbi:MAG: AAA family ATPase [Fibrobacterota bacterium]
MDLFESSSQDQLLRHAPLADRMRPQNLEEFVGQERIIGPGRLLRRAIEADRLSSIIFYGPPGTGKTTLARIIANQTKSEFLSLNAVLSGVKDIRQSIETAKRLYALYSKRTILFIDEVHRFNKSQQDALLPHVESGIILLIGATTENPYFEVNKALVSRSRIFQLEKLESHDIKQVIYQALQDSERGLGGYDVSIDSAALDHVCTVANGDARAALNAVELAVMSSGSSEQEKIIIDLPVMEESIQKRAVLYDKDGDSHYDIISAFIKSVRGSDPDAALYWMAKMVYAGEDPRFIFRRMIILASEDIGLADPQALQVVMSAAQAYDYIGMPEGQYPMAQACLYLSTADKSNTAMAYFDALSTVQKSTKDSVPDHLCDPSRDRDGLGHGAGYSYPHAYRDHWVQQQYLPTPLRGRFFYTPSDQGYEASIAKKVNRRRELQMESHLDEGFESGGVVQSRDAEWSKRSSGTSDYLSLLRSFFISSTGVEHRDLVLDITAKRGLLTFEFLRNASQGGVWSVVRTRADAEIIQSGTVGRDLLSTPVVIEAFDEAKNSWVHTIPQDVGFDIVVGRDVVDAEDIIFDVPYITQRCRQNCRIIFTQNIPFGTSRFSTFLTGDLQKIFSDMETRLCEEKEKLSHVFASKLKNISQETSFAFSQRRETLEFTRRFSSHQIRSWLQPSGQLQSILTDAGYDLKVAEKMLKSALTNKPLPWKADIQVYEMRRGY